MESFALYNYQFEKIAEHGRQLELEGFGKVVMTADEAFPDRQKIFGEKGFRSKYNDYRQGKIKLRHKEEIDTILK